MARGLHWSRRYPNRGPLLTTPADRASPAPDTTVYGSSSVPAGWADRLRRLILDVRLVAHDHVELLVLEAERASQALVRSIAAAVVISVLVATAWLGLVVAAVVWLAENMPLPAALLIGAIACLALAGGIAWWVMKHLPDLMFSATLRQLKATAQADDEADHDADDKGTAK